MIPKTPCEKKADYLNQMALIASSNGNYKESDALHYYAETIRREKKIDIKVIENIYSLVSQQPQNQTQSEICEIFETIIGKLK